MSENELNKMRCIIKKKIENLRSKSKISIPPCPKCQKINQEKIVFCPICDTFCCCLPYYILHIGSEVCMKVFQKSAYKTFMNIKHQFGKADYSGKSINYIYTQILNKLFPTTFIPLTKDAIQMKALIDKIDSLKNVVNEHTLLPRLCSKEKNLYFKLKGDLDLKPPKGFYPFWLKVETKHRDIIVDDDEDDNMELIEDERRQRKLCIQMLMTEIPPLSDVTKLLPSDLCFTNLCNIIAVFSIIYRFYEGDHIIPYAVESTAQMIYTSGVFLPKTYYPTKKAAIEDALVAAETSLYLSYTYVNKTLLEDDVDNILEGSKDDRRLFILFTLGHINQMFKESYDNDPARKAKKQKSHFTSQEFKTSPFLKPISHEILTDCIKLVRFLYSYVLSYYSEDWLGRE